MAKDGDNSFGIASVVLGITSISVSFLILPSAILGILSIIFGCLQYKTNKNKWAIWGIVLGILSLVLTLALLYYYSVLSSQLAAQLQAQAAAGTTA